MGLRINTNINATAALRNLGIADRFQSRSLERLSTGLRINRASDDPAGLVISEQLRAQIGSLEQALENSEFASNLVGTADAALTEVSNLLVKIRESAIFALNTGGTSAEQVAAEQDAVDSAISSIDRIAATTRFGSTSLLNGSSGFNVTSQSTSIADLNVRSADFNGATAKTFNVEVTAAATRARVNFRIGSGSTGVATASGTQVFRITGNLGTEEIFVASGASTQDVMAAVNAVRSNTGVYAVLASGAAGTEAAANIIGFVSEDFGANQKVAFEVVSGSTLTAFVSSGTAGTFADVTAGGELNATGGDISVIVNGARAETDGNNISITSSFLTAELTVADNTAATASGSPLAFVVQKSGLDFQLNIEPRSSDLTTLGLPNVSSEFLGSAVRTLGSGTAGVSSGGFLSSILSGGANDLSTDAENAVRVLDAAIADINGLRGFLGAFEADTIQSNINSLGIALENLTATESEIRDLDFAAETAEFTRTQILFAAGTSVLASANLVPQTILTLLT